MKRQPTEWRKLLPTLYLTGVLSPEHSSSPPFLYMIYPQAPSGCLKLQIVPNPNILYFFLNIIIYDKV